MSSSKTAYYALTIESAKTAYNLKDITARYLIFVYLQIKAGKRGYTQVAIQSIMEDLDLHSTTVYAALRVLKKQHEIKIKRGLAKINFKPTELAGKEQKDDWASRFQSLSAAEQEEYLKACGVFEESPGL
ncbi:MAG: hypothetical protein ACRCZS_01650 [Chroococcidiopsis sp.]